MTGRLALLGAAILLAAGCSAPRDFAEVGVVGPVAKDPCGAPVLRPTGTPWLCTFADDFDGDSLDPDRWQPLTTLASGARQPECRVDDPANIAVSDGVLELTARVLDSPTHCEAADGFYVTRKTAGGVTTSKRFAQAFGRVEIRAALPAYDGVGFHSALWLYPQAEAYGEWPRSGEIDLAEYRTGLPGTVVPTLHLMAQGRHRVVARWDCVVAEPEEFHTYVLVWTPAGIQFSYDGVVCLTQRFDPARPFTAKPFDQPFFLVLNQSHGIHANQADSSTPESATMRVDWVKVWR